MLYTAKKTVRKVKSAVALLRTLIVVALSAITIGLVVTVLVLCVASRQQDRIVTELSLQQFQGLLSLQSRHLEVHVRDYAFWNDAIEGIIVQPNVQWWEANAGQQALLTFDLAFSLATGIEQMYFQTTATETLSAQSVADMPWSNSLHALLAEARQLPIAADSATPIPVAMGLVEMNNSLYLAGAARFLNETTRTPPPADPDALLVFGQSLDDTVLPSIMHIMGDLDYQYLNATSEYTINLPLRLMDQSLAGVIAWQPHKPGRAMLGRVLPWISVAFLAVAVLTLVFAFRAQKLAKQLHDDAAERRKLALRYQSILDTAGDGIFGIDHDGQTLFVNTAALELLGYSRAEFPSQDAYARIMCCKMRTSQCVGDSDEQQIRTLLSGSETATHDSGYFRRQNGDCFPVEYIITPMREADTLMGGVVVFRDITQRREDEQTMHYRANHDTLTGLPNRNLLLDRLNQEIKHARREQHRIGVLFIDLNKFKQVNDALGHQFGDALLRQVALRLQSGLRETDTIGRFGGDEFVVILSQILDTDMPAKAATKILTMLDEPFHLEGQTAHIGASIGIALFPDHGHDVDTLIHSADVAMYDAKSAGSGHYCFAQAHSGTEPSSSHPTRSD